MLIRVILSRLILTLLYAALVTLLGRHFGLEFLLFWLGMIIGAMVFYFDPLVTTYFGSTVTTSEQEIKQMVDQKRFAAVVGKVLILHQSQEQPILHSAFLQCILMLLSFYIITSSGSLFGSGLVMGMVFHLIQEEITIWWKEPQRLKRILFWNIHRELSDKELQIYLGVILVFFVIETTLLI